MAEHELEGPVIGLSLDGTGYGTDGRIWGGEVLIVRLDGPAHRASTASPISPTSPMPGGEAAIREPWRMALGHLHAAGIDLKDPFISNALGSNPKEAALVQKMIARGINTPLTSSCGRLFDAVAALVLHRRVVDYEAQAAIELEGIAVDEPDDTPGYSFEFIERMPASPEGELSIIPTMGVLDLASMWKELLADLRTGKSRSHISACFHGGIANAFIQAALRARSATGIAQIALSGGCLHNRRLARLLREGLDSAGFQVFQHRQASPGDGGLSYGQAVIAAAILRSRREQGPSSP